MLNIKLKNRGSPDDAVRLCNQLNATLYLPTDEQFLRQTFKYDLEVTILFIKRYLVSYLTFMVQRFISNLYLLGSNGTDMTGFI